MKLANAAPVLPSGAALRVVPGLPPGAANYYGDNMTTIEEATEYQLRRELERRSEQWDELAKRSRMALSTRAPQRLETIDTTDLVGCCEQYRDFLTSENYHEDRLSKYEGEIVDAAVTAVFGDEFWDWVNEAMG